jgi:outer membrane protein TolC
LPSPADIDPSHVYSLVELIDIAQRRNPATRVAWEQARQAAIGVGIARAAYLPALTVSALAGYEHVVGPFPTNLVPQGFITFNAQEVFPQLTVKYLLLDFGGRAAAVEAAGQLSIAGNAAFTAAHQQLIFNVARAYFMLDGTIAAVRAAGQALTDAQVVQRSAEALSSRGLATVVNVELARRDTAQAQFDLAQATAAQHDAMYTLLAAMDLSPTTKLRWRMRRRGHCRPTPSAPSTTCSAKRCTSGPICWPMWQNFAQPTRTSPRHAPPSARNSACSGTYRAISAG